MRKISVWAMTGLCILFLVLSLSTPRRPGDTDAEAARVERIVASRLERMYSLIDRGSTRLPDDMVAYRYSGDSLVSWINHFPVFNDDLNPGSLPDRMVNPRMRTLSPLAEVGEEAGFYNFGSKWYLARSIRTEDGCCIAGLEIMDSMEGESLNGVNRKFHLNDNYSVKPLSASGGTAVNVDSRAQFKILCDSHRGNATADPGMVCLAFVFFVLAAFLYVFNGKTLVRALRASLVTVIVMAALLFWGHSAQNEIRLFSPAVYAGKLFFSLGAVVIVNMAIFLVTGFLYLSRLDIQRRIAAARHRVPVRLATAVAIAAIALYSVQVFRSIVINSSFSMDLLSFGGFSVYGALVLFSFVSMMLSIPMLLRTIDFPLDLFSVKGRMAYSLLISVFLVITVAVLGLSKEQYRLKVWANRLAVSRDIPLELRLRRMEPQIASDVLIPALAQLDNASTIQNRISETYFFRISQDYNISVHIINDRSLPSEIASFNDRVRPGEQISADSRFVFVDPDSGRPRYAGIFLYYGEQTGLVRMLLEVEPKVARYQGYAEIFQLSSPGRVMIPSRYSYARYKGNDLLTYHGTYAYPTVMEDWVSALVYESRESSFKSDSYRHFVSLTDDDEAVIISRSRLRPFSYIIEVLSVSLVIFFILSLFCIRPGRKENVHRAYFKKRISAVIMTSLILTLVVLASVSVIFVYRSNEENMYRLMTGKINSIQTMVKGRIDLYGSFGDLRPSDMSAILAGAGEDSSSDITLYSADGRLLMSTAPEVFDRMILGGRINAEAYEDIIVRNRRCCVCREKSSKRHFYSMYAPLTDDEGKVLAIICSPYTETGYRMERDALMHSLTVLTVFIILLLLARVMVTAVIDRMFKPLSEMGHKMSSANLDSLEYIEYNQDDEVQTLVHSYNRMVSELSESARKLAQAERDMAWSGMARQVAHEIKNPLTPMKLQLQRLIRLKQKGAPEWQDKFDEVAGVLLDHIDILSDTANEFSTFAKLYSEEHTSINVDALLQEEISMFDNREDVQFEYRGLKDAVVMGPKPQLTRVFVNLISNAVQAVEGVENASVLVSLRNSSAEDRIDIVVEDNGAGVSAENVEKLFTPNFTTKNGGSGLGLAISRSILESCGATIEYSRSFALGGACFTISYPK